MIALLSLVWPALADDLSVSSRVAGVTVYLDRARVTREVTVDIPAGRTDLVFDALPIQLLPASLAAEGEGTAGATLTGIDLRPRRGVEDRDVRVAALNQERQTLADRIGALQDVVARVQADVGFLQSLKPQAPAKLEQGLFLADDVATQMTALSRQVGADLVTLLREQRAAEIQIRGLAREVERIDRETGQLTNGGNEDTMRVAVGLDAARAGSVTVRLQYVIGGCGWTPHYDARYRIDDGEVRLELSGEVTQQTGEDWAAVELILSTARPQEGTAPPTLSPFLLQESYGLAGYEDDALSAEYGEGRRTSAVVADRVAAFEFTAPQDEDVPADGTRRRVYLATMDLPSEVVHQVVARRLESAWLTARVTNGAEFALLAGSVSAYMGTAYVGEGYVPLTAPGEVVDLSFGVDDRVRVKRVRVEQVASDARALGNKERERYGWKTTVTNHTGRDVALRVLDQVPVSREAAFEVEARATPAVAFPPDGVFTWEANLPDGATQDFAIDYEVTWPENDRPNLLD
jgi:hypothetical protein